MYSIIVLKIYIYLFRSEEKKERKKELSSFVPDLGRAQFYFYTGRITKKNFHKGTKLFSSTFNHDPFSIFFFFSRRGNTVLLPGEGEGEEGRRN